MNSTKTVPFDKDQFNFYNKLNQFGEYKYNNRLDTLFIFQLTFILILVFVILSYLSAQNVISPFIKWVVTFIFGSFVFLVFLSHAIVLPRLRDKNNWDRMNFGDGTIAPASYVSGGIAGGRKGNAPTTGEDPKPKCVPVEAVTCDE